MKAITNKIEQNKAQYSLQRETAKISALSSGIVTKYEFLIGRDVLKEKKLARKSCCIETIQIFAFRQRIKSIN